jgi:uncharacterized protein YacL
MNRTPLALIILRAVFVMVSVGIAALIINTEFVKASPPWVPWAVLGGGLAVPSLVIAGDALIRQKNLTVITAVYFGVIVGVFLTYATLLAMGPMLPSSPTAPINIWMPPVIGAVMCYICTSLLLQTQDEFRFLIPYVEFARDVKGLRPNVLDTSVIIDGRIADLAASGIFESRFVVPAFVVDELRVAADAHDRSKRLRARRGLDVLDRMRSSPGIDIEVLSASEQAGEDATEDSRVLALARRLDGRVITNDPALVKMAAVRSVLSVNINDVAVSLKPVFVPGEAFEVRVVRVGEEPGQGVGYLEDGTMVVVEGARDNVGRTIHVTVTSTLQRSGGRLIFAKPDQAA